MKTIPAALRGHLSGEATTLCRCWRLTRRDGAVMGFTDHDRAISLSGTVFEASSGVAPSDLEETGGLAADSSQISGALVSERISEEDVAKGLYDGARVEVFIVNWSDPGQRMAEHEYLVGQVVREGGAFRAELRGPNAALDQTRGRRFSRLCDADLGDARCGVSLTDEDWSVSGVVESVRGRVHLRIACPKPPFPGFFRNGRATFETGAGAGLSAAISSHVREGNTEVATLWEPAAFSIAEGDQVRLTAGCDKHFATCRDRFANSVNFRGFPHIPGNDFALGYATTFDRMDGGALVP